MNFIVDNLSLIELLTYITGALFFIVFLWYIIATLLTKSKKVTTSLDLDDITSFSKPEQKKTAKSFTNNKSAKKIGLKTGFSQGRSNVSNYGGGLRSKSTFRPKNQNTPLNKPVDELKKEAFAKPQPPPLTKSNANIGDLSDDNFEDPWRKMLKKTISNKKKVRDLDDLLDNDIGPVRGPKKTIKRDFLDLDDF